MKENKGYDRKSMLRADENTSPYGLYHCDGKPFEDWEMEAIFDGIGLTQEELEDLNRYMNDDPSHTFLDRPFPCLTEKNYVTQMRAAEELGEMYMMAEETASYTCGCNGERWRCRIRQIAFRKGYVRFRVEGRGSSIDAYVGDCDGEIWICFPYHMAGSSLADPDNVSWNSERISYLLKSEPDGITVAGALKKLRRYIIEPGIEQDMDEMQEIEAEEQYIAEYVNSR